MKSFNYGYEIFELVTDSDYEEEVIVEMLLYLYQNCRDTRLLSLIEQWFSENDYCLGCGEKLQLHEYRDYHSEVGYYEDCGELYCPNCD